MKWNKAWDDCNNNGYDNPVFCAGAWTTNEYNGMLPDGAQSNWHYKIIWVGSAGENSPYWQAGGYSVWGNYEVIQDFGFDPNGHYKYAQAHPAGLGQNKQDNCALLKLIIKKLTSFSLSMISKVT